MIQCIAKLASAKLRFACSFALALHKEQRVAKNTLSCVFCIQGVTEKRR